MASPVSIPIRAAQELRPIRGVGWVLRWAATLFMLAIAAVVVLEFGYRIVAEQSLRRAAVAGIQEAALPRANRRSVEQVIHSRLGSGTRLSRSTKAQLWFRPGISNQLQVALIAPADAALPDWLQLVTFWNSRAKITVRAGG